jgi:hypothetical protein
MTKDLLLHLPSRSRPEFLYDTIQTLFYTCASGNNYDILCQIDDDEIELYADVKNKISEKYSNVKWEYLKHDSNSWYNIIENRHKFITQNDYYFIWPISDDSVIFGLNEEWDTNILSKKGYFKDGLFMMYSKTDFWGRNQHNFEKCFNLHETDYDNGIALLHTHEMMPVMTKKFMDFVWEIHKDKDWTGNVAEIISSLIYKLSREYNLNRHVPVEIKYGGMNNDYRSAQISYDGVSRDQAYIDLISNNYSSLMPIINQMYEYIKSYESK